MTLLGDHLMDLCIVHVGKEMMAFRAGGEWRQRKEKK